MKKLLSILGVLSLSRLGVLSLSSLGINSVIACKGPESSTRKQTSDDENQTSDDENQEQLGDSNGAASKRSTRWR